jgi:xanthosine utilization system XapX-like protein
MGFLADLRSGKRDGAFGHAIIAWAIIGAGTGIVSALLFLQSENAIPILATIGGLLGISVGFYAEWGTSKLAKLLAVPGMIVRSVVP